VLNADRPLHYFVISDHYVLLFAAAEEDGGPHTQVPDSQQPNLCRVEQIPAYK